MGPLPESLALALGLLLQTICTAVGALNYAPIDSGQEQRDCRAAIAAPAGAVPPRVVVSVATTGTEERQQHLKRAIDSLWNQTWKPDRLILTYPYRFERFNQTITVPDEVQQWREVIPALTLQQMEDYGPASKLLGALHLEKDPETIVIVGDDDALYHPRVVETLVCTILKPPTKEEVAPAFAGEAVCPIVAKNRFHPTARYFGYARGVGAAAYRVRYFDDFVWRIKDPETPKGCFTNDDAWIGGAMKRASGVLPFHVDKKRAGFDSVLAHDNCDGEKCRGMKAGRKQADSTSTFNTKALGEGRSLKTDCEHYFNDFCCPELCPGGKYEPKHRDPYFPAGGTIWGPAAA